MTSAHYCLNYAFELIIKLVFAVNRLKKTGLINISQEGMSMKYSLNPEKATIIKRHVASLFQL